MHISFPAIAANAGSVQGPSPRLVNAAHEFEAQLMKELMKPLTSSAAPGDDDDSSDDEAGMSLGAGSTDALDEFASEALARALSNSGGFGIANKIIGQLSKREASEIAHSGTLSAASAGAGKDRIKSASALRK